MNITFFANNPYWGQLSNTGGSKTIIRSAETLRDLGHKSEIVATKDKFTYFPHRKPVKKIPKDTDVLIAVSVSELREVNKFPGKRVFWMRGYEKWRKINVISEIKKFTGSVIVNSSWMKTKLEKHGIKSQVCFAGYDDVWEDYSASMFRPIMTGVLYHKQHKTKNYKFFLKVKEKLGTQFTSVEIGRQPMNDKQLKKVYQSCDIWFAPTELEGFHNVPLEANLCGALVVCSNHPRNGMSDYANENTATIYKHGDIQSAAEAILKLEFGKVEKMQKHIKQNIGTRQECMTKFVKILEDL